MSTSFTLNTYLDLNREYWNNPNNHKKQRFGQFILNKLDNETMNSLKEFLGDDYNRIYYTESYDEVNDYIIKYLLAQDN